MQHQQRSRGASAPTSSASSSTSVRSAESSAPSNAALASSLPASASAEETPLLDAMVETPAPEKSSTNSSSRKRNSGRTASAATAATPEVAPEADPVSRPSKITKGMSGALLGTGGDIILKSDAALAGSDVATVADGTGAKVVESKSGAVKVQVRQGTKNVTGWVSAAVFSDQPALAKDEDHPGLMQDLTYTKVEGDLSGAGAKEGAAPTSQGGLGDCYLIASMAALHFANPDFAKQLVVWDAAKKRYIVTFHEPIGRNSFEEVKIEVDGYLPTQGTSQDPSYAGDPGEALWGAIVEKAYAKWKGGYADIEGGDGGQALQEMTGVKSAYKDPASMKESDVVPYFQKAQKNKEAIYAGVINSTKVEHQTPLSGQDGKYEGAVRQPHDWNEIQVGTVQVIDGSGQVAAAKDQGEEEAKTGKIVGKDVKSGTVDYKGSDLSLEYKAGKKPASAEDLQVHFETHGVVLPSKMLIGNHAYAFSGVTADGLLQFYNPWGSYQPKPITAAEFLQYFDSLSTNAGPKS